jgi:transmembrane sensor
MHVSTNDPFRALTSAEQGTLTAIESGDIAPDDPRAQALLAVHPGVQRYIDTVRTSAAPAATDETMLDTAFARVAARVQRQSAPRPVRPMYQRRPIVVASLTAIAFFSIIGVALLGNLRARPAMSLSRTYATEAGQRAIVTLSDGSVAHLGPSTTVVVRMDDANTSTDIRVAGQVLFTATHDRTRTFRVHAGAATTSVLGTTFLVRRYDTDSVTRVVVADGRVSLRGTHDHEHVLTARMLGTVDDSGMVRVQPNIVIDDYTRWTTGDLVFRKTPARDVVAEIGRAYGVEIRIADSALAAQPLSWTVTLTRRSLTGVLEPLAGVLDAHVTRAGRVITLVPGRSASPKSIDTRSSHSSETQYGK